MKNYRSMAGKVLLAIMLMSSTGGRDVYARSSETYDEQMGITNQPTNQ